MKALVYLGPMNVKIIDFEIPSCGSDELLVRVIYSAICATDVKTITKGHALIKPPAVLGHEMVGEVVKVGENVTGFSEGDKVVVGPYAPCGYCFYCRRGLYTCCENLFSEAVYPGGFSEFVRVPPRIVKSCTFKVSRARLEEAALTEPLACCIKGLRTSGFSSGDNVAIFGAGPIGLTHLMLVRRLGARKVMVVDIDANRLEMAKKLGADAVLNPREEDVEDRIKNETDGRGADIVLTDTPAFEAVKSSINSARKGATVCLFAGFSPSAHEYAVDLNAIHYREINLVGSFGYTPQDFYLANQMLENRIIQLSPIITHIIGLEGVLEAIKLIQRHEALKVVVKMGEGK